MGYLWDEFLVFFEISCSEAIERLYIRTISIKWKWGSRFRGIVYRNFHVFFFDKFGSVARSEAYLELQRVLEYQH